MFHTQGVRLNLPYSFVEIPVYCPENYRLCNGRCFGAHQDRLNFFDAEAECNKLRGGHLAAFRLQQELDFIESLLGFQFGFF